MSKEKKALGKGLDILFSRNIAEEEAPVETSSVVQSVPADSLSAFIEIEEIKINSYQPREEFEEEALKELSDSIKQKGIIQPITVRKMTNGEFELVAGERRLRASKLAGLKKIPAYVIEVKSDEDLLELSLIENIQREDLNAIEIAQSYHRLIEEYKLTQEQIAEKVGKSRSSVTNFLRLLRLPEEIKQSIRKDEISEGHARAILAVENEVEQINLWKRILGESLTVRKTEEFAKKTKKNREKKFFIVTDQNKTAIEFLESKFREHFGTKVKIHPKTKTSGEIIVEYYTPEDLERIVELCRK